MIKDQEVDSLINQIGTESDAIDSIGAVENNFSEAAVKMFGQALDSVQKLVPASVQFADPVSSIPTIANMINGAVEQEILPPEFQANERPETDKELRLLTAQINSIVKDRATARDFKDFLNSPKPGPEEAAIPEPSAEPPDRVGQLMNIQSKGEY